MVSAVQWHVGTDYELLWYEWDSESIVYHSGTGDTHLFNPAAAEVLKILQRQPVTLEALVARIIDEDESSVQFQGDDLKVILRQFYQLNLIEPLL